MIALGKVQSLKIIRESLIGVYLNTSEESEYNDILLPQKQVPEGASVGDDIEVFVYRDSEDRLIATTNTPRITLGELEVLKVIEVNEIGAFLNWGLEKDLFLPFTEQVFPVEKGRKYLFGLYIDKSDRLSATMYIERLLSSESPYKENDRITGTIYSIKEDFGALVAVDNKFFGLIHASDFYGNYKVGNKIEARVLQARDDGKLDLSLREKAVIQVGEDAAFILSKLERSGGFLPLNDKSSPEEINKEFAMSKGSFKKAIGGLYKERIIKITEVGIEKVED
ncbi:MAG TPA: S1 RNA-binding domain-containing protein [Epulopiscium sp.]|nr:S1 RNA-binding domain-containing protein [Candidatus Epulonipiscium sp.]